VADPAIAATIAELGLAIANRVPRAVTAGDVRNADIVVATESGLLLPADPAGRLTQWNVPDPAACDIDSVRPLRDAVAQRIRAELLAE
jgi:arsenate reductase